MTRVLVIVPCYNYARYLEACVRSVLAQRDVQVAVLIIDDCSSDETPEVCRKLAQEDARVGVIRHAVNKGHIATFNEGLEHTQGDYLVLISADDMLTPGSLARASALMNAHPNVGMVYGCPIPFHDRYVPPANTSGSSWTVWKGAEWLERSCRAGVNFMRSPEVMLRASVQRSIGGYRPSLPHSSDMNMWLRAAMVADVGYVKGSDQAYYRIHDTNMHRTVHSGFMYDLKARYDAFLDAFETQGSLLPERDRLRSMAWQALARIAIRQAIRVSLGQVREGTSVAQYRQFALRICPEIVGTSEWRRLERLDNGAWKLRALAERARGRLRSVVDSYDRRKLKRDGIF